MNMPPLLPAAPEIFLAMCSMILLIFGVFRGDKSTRTVSWLAVCALIVCGIILTAIQQGRMVTVPEDVLTQRVELRA